MLIVAAVLLVIVGLMHSVRGGRNLIEPIIIKNGLPAILGGLNDAKFTLRAGWHLLTLTWWCNAAVLVSMELQPETLSPVFLFSNATLYFGTAVAALALTSGRHLSWVFFIPIAIMLGVRGWIAL